VQQASTKITRMLLFVTSSSMDLTQWVWDTGLFDPQAAALVHALCQSRQPGFP
jgi:hypothetical protein